MKAILQVADTGPLESLVVMLRAVGYTCYLPNMEIQRKLRDLGCDTVLEVDHLVRNWGYERPMDLPIATLSDMKSANLYVDVKAHRNGPRIWGEFPNLKNRTLWYRINGCAPEHVIRNGEDFGDERDPPCPILTPNQWYKEDGPWRGRAYVCWPPFYRLDTYGPRHPTVKAHVYDPPMCLIHNLEGWGYGKLVAPLVDIGVKCFGVGSPDGLLPHAEVRQRLKRTIALVHLKSSDAPGYALYEAMATGTPLVITRRLIWRSHMEELFTPDENCRVFDRPTHESLSDEDVALCTNEVKFALESLANPTYNKKIGDAARNRLLELMWDERNLVDVESLAAFMRRF